MNRYPARPATLQSLRGANIAHLIESSGPGGAERMIVELAQAQQQHGATVTVFIPRGRESWLSEQLQTAGVSTEYFTLTSPLSPPCVRTLYRAFRRYDIALAHSHEFTMATNGAFAARWAGIPHVITMHGGRYYATKLRRRLLMRAAVEASQATVAVSEPLGDALSTDLRITRSRIETIPNGIRMDVVAAAPLRHELGLAPGEPLVLAVGNLYPVKGHRILLEALHALPANTHLAIAGRGREESVLRSRAAVLGLSNRLHLLGHRDDVPALLLAADVFVQPSLDEGLPLAVLEAMTSARPIVATDVGDVGRAVGPGGGLLVPPGDASALAAAITMILQKPFLAKALAQTARTRALLHYGASRMVGRYADVYAPLMPTRAVAEAMAKPSASAQRSMRPKTSVKTGSD